MKKLLLTLTSCMLSVCCVLAQDSTFDLPASDNSYANRKISGYYHAGWNKVIINEKLKGGVQHSLYDTNFNLINRYTIDYEKEGDKTKKKLDLVKPISWGNNAWEVYASNKLITIYSLDFAGSMDKKIAEINYKADYKNARVVAVLPQRKGCIFLLYSDKKKDKKLVVYNWQGDNNVLDKSEYPLPQYTLSAEELKKYSKYHSLNYKECFIDMSVSHCNRKDLFQVPGQGQVFYNDSALYIVNRAPISTGINVLTVNFEKKELRCNNYFLNEANFNALGTNLQKYSIAAIYDSTLIIENCSDKILEYHFFNLYSGTAIKKYNVDVQDSLNYLVHSPLKQLGTYGSANEEKELKKEKIFIRRKNNGMQFIKPLLVGDSLVITMGSFVRTEGIEGTLLMASTFAMGYSLHIVVDNTQYIPYMVSHRNKFVYAHSKFSIADWSPSAATNTATIWDQLMDIDKLRDARKDNSIVLDLQNKLFLAVYNRRTEKYEVIRFYQ